MLSACVWFILLVASFTGDLQVPDFELPLDWTIETWVYPLNATTGARAACISSGTTVAWYNNMMPMCNPRRFIRHTSMLSQAPTSCHSPLRPTTIALWSSRGSGTSPGSGTTLSSPGMGWVLSFTSTVCCCSRSRSSSSSSCRLPGLGGAAWFFPHASSHSSMLACLADCVVGLLLLTQALCKSRSDSRSFAASTAARFRLVRSKTPSEAPSMQTNLPP